MHRLISPNWHVMFVHFPLALLTFGVLIELFSSLWRRSSVRTAARWMILLGALSALPAITTGIFAFHDAAVRSTPLKGDAEWSQVVSKSPWQPQQWTFMKRHIWLESVGGGVFALLAIGYLALSDRSRESLRLPWLAAMLLALIAISWGAYYSGESIYRYGTAVEAAGTRAPTGPAASGWLQATLEAVPRAQVHLFGVGLTLALAAAGIGLTLRRWALETPRLEHDEFASETEPTVGQEPHVLPTPAPDVVIVNQPQPSVYPARFWLLGTLLALATAAAGVWLSGDLNELREIITAISNSQLRRNLSTDQTRMGIHMGLAVAIILLLLILAAVTRWSPRTRVPTVVLTGLLAAAVGVQIWIGVLMLYNM